MESKQKSESTPKLFEAVSVVAPIFMIGAVYVLSTVPGTSPPSTVSVLLRPATVQSVQAEAKAKAVDRRAVRSVDLHALVKSIASVESGNDASAIGDGGEAIGLLQIHRITVDDVNRIMGEDIYTYADRLDPGKSIEMFMVSSKHYAKHWNDWTAEGVSRRWNGGPTGHRKQATIKYWRKVKALYEV